MWNGAGEWKKLVNRSTVEPGNVESVIPLLALEPPPRHTRGALLTSVSVRSPTHRSSFKRSALERGAITCEAGHVTSLQLVRRLQLLLPTSGSRRSGINN